MLNIKSRISDMGFMILASVFNVRKTYNSRFWASDGAVCRSLGGFNFVPFRTDRAGRAGKNGLGGNGIRIGQPRRPGLDRLLVTEVGCQLAVPKRTS